MDNDLLNFMSRLVVDLRYLGILLTAA
jgi:hypothetical protein